MGVAPTEVAFVVIPRFNMATLTAMIEPLRIANYLESRPLYRWDVRAGAAGPVGASNGMTLACAGLDEGPAPELVAVFGSWGAEHHDDTVLHPWLRRRARKGARLIGVELGVYALARAGLLAGRRATTHWSWKAGFVESFPAIDVCEQLYTIDGAVMTCAGGTAGLDLMLAVVAADHGEALATEIANQLLYAPRRPAEGRQRAAGAHALDPAVEAALALLEEHVGEPLSVPDLARAVGVSQRQLERLFRRHTGCTVVQFATLMRLQYARVLLTGTALTIREISAACGFNSLSYFSTCFARVFGRKPSAYRRAWPDDEPAPSWPGTAYDFMRSAQKPASPRR